MAMVQREHDESSPEKWNRKLLRFLTSGSVDNGKSTLIGRLLYDSKLVFDDQLAALEKDSRKYGTNGKDIDFALLMDGLEAEREQAITIDVAYRYFATPRRSFIVADAPGHEQYTRNMVTGASNSDLAVIVVDARKGVLAQTQRHTTICSLLGIRHVVLAVNKIDLVGYEEAAYERIAKAYRDFVSQLSFDTVVPIPVSARLGDNIAVASGNTGWYRGPTLLEHLETVDVDTDIQSKPFRFAVQLVSRPHPDFRGLSGTVASGRVRRGDAVILATSGAIASIKSIVTADGEFEEARAGDAVTLTLSHDIDAGRGELLSHGDQRPAVADQFSAHVIWMDDGQLLPGRPYMMRIGTRWVPATVTAIKHKLSVEHLNKLATRSLTLNEIGFCNLSTAAPVAFDAYVDNRTTGGFILVDRYSNNTVAAGTISFVLRRATNIHRERLAADKSMHASIKGQRPCIVWFTGLAASGKSTIARLVEDRLLATGHHTYQLDGDNLRHGINRDLGFTDADRVENIRRAGEVAKLFVDAGLIVLCAFISPFRAERAMVRALVESDEFIEVFVDTPLEECRRRDPKGLYAKALAGGIKNFTGIDSAYEPPTAPELVLHTTVERAERLADKVIECLRQSGCLRALKPDS